VNLSKITKVAVLLLIAVISFTKIAPWAGDALNHTHSIEQTENKITTVMSLSGGAAATSATLSLLPGDLCSPLAEQLAELAKYFLLILSALYLEKYLITISGYIAFSILIPGACLFISAGILMDKRSLYRIAGKLCLLALVVFFIVPTSVWISDIIYTTQESKIENTLEEYEDLDIEESEGGIFEQLTSLTNETIEKVTSFISNLLESLAVMIVTACVVPVLVVIFLVWLLKIIFNTNELTLNTDSLEKLLKKDKNNKE
jgi:hypothetical protein